jgi:hypothetical protein
VPHYLTSTELELSKSGTAAIALLTRLFHFA